MSACSQKEKLARCQRMARSGLFYTRFIDDILVLAQTRWRQLIAGVQGSGGHESVAPESFYEYCPNVVRPVFLAGCGAFGTFAASGLAPHLGQATTSFLRS